MTLDVSREQGRWTSDVNKDVVRQTPCQVGRVTPDVPTEQRHLAPHSSRELSFYMS